MSPALPLVLLLAALCAPTRSHSYYTSTPADGGTCPGDDWRPYQGRCYWRSTFVAPWRIIGDLCQLVDADARPVSIHNNDENYFVTGMAKSDSWIGLKRYGGTKDWKWSDGTPYDFARGSHSGPSDQCMSVADNVWSARSCEEDLYFICHVEMKVEPTTDQPESTTWNPWGPTTRDPWGPTTREPWDTTTRDPWGPTTMDPWGPTTRYPWDTTTRYPWWPTTRDPWGPTTRDPWGPTTRDPWSPTTRDPWDTTTRYPWWPTTREPWDTTTKDPWGPTTRYPWHSTTTYPWWPTTRHPYWPTSDPPYTSERPTGTPCTSEGTREPTTPERPSSRYPWPTSSEAPTTGAETSTDWWHTTSDYPYWRKEGKEDNDKRRPELEEGGEGVELKKAERREVEEIPVTADKEEVNVMPVTKEAELDVVG
ncbi:proteoglycan 4-like [Amphibalanus amphitrite]|uniref:proteoglycan 4-like n=1 Tax=Amphibalanus amphitrite TaxID=1232801 RepID=UPI001C926114|nr:proteoglycan 4-like [Amphibalanus amphitrite]